MAVKYIVFMPRFVTGHIYIHIMPHCLADKNHAYKQNRGVLRYRVSHNI